MSRCKSCNDILPSYKLSKEYNITNVLCDQCIFLSKQRFIYTEEHTYILEGVSFSYKTEVVYE